MDTTPRKPEPILRSYTVVCPDKYFHRGKDHEDRDSRLSGVDVVIPHDKIFILRNAQRLHGNLSTHDALLEENFIGSSSEVNNLRVLWLPDPIPNLPFHKYNLTLRELRFSCPAPIQWVFQILPCLEVLETLQFGSKFFYGLDQDFQPALDYVKTEFEEILTIKDLSCIVDRKGFSSFDVEKQKNICNRVAGILRNAKRWLPNLTSVDLNVPNSLETHVHSFVDNYSTFKGAGTLTIDNENHFILYKKRPTRPRTNINHDQLDDLGSHANDRDTDEESDPGTKKIKLEADEDPDIIELEEIRHGSESDKEIEFVTISDDDDEPACILTPPQEETSCHTQTKPTASASRPNTARRSNENPNFNKNTYSSANAQKEKHRKKLPTMNGRGKSPPLM